VTIGSPDLQADVRAEYRRRGRGIAIDTCEEIVSGRMAPFEGARTIWLEAWTLLSDQPEGNQLLPFIGATTEWEDHPEARVEIEADILRMTNDLLNRWHSI